MQVISNTDTICAIATPPGAGGIGVVRISGPDAFAVMERIWRGKVHPSNFKPRKLYLGEVNITSHDRVMAVKMPSPHTYTGQDVAELSCHGSQVVLKSIVEACIAAGARVAGPGEFTRRAFLAGKMDLAQAEAVSDLIHATSERGAKLAADQLEGRLSSEIRGISSQLADLRGEVEASIDFPAEGIVVSGESFERRIGGIIRRVRDLADTYERGRIAREGLRVAIVGRPNSGKSSILNSLAGIDRAIVHHTPGTTRDVVEECVSFDGVVVRLRDTAGMRESAAEVEALGIDRTREEIERADLALVVFDGSVPFGQEDEVVLKRILGSRCIYVVNKMDLTQRFDPKSLSDAAKGHRFHVVSAKTGEGMEGLSNRVVGEVLGDALGEILFEGVTVTSARHRAVLGEAEAELTHALDAYGRHEPIECIAQHLRVAHEALGTITGEVATEELLDRIFSTFCIGK